jgi:hypothetical protein
MVVLQLWRKAVIYLYKHTVYLVDGDAIVGRNERKSLAVRKKKGEAFFVVEDFGLRHMIPISSVVFVESEEVES